MKPEEDFVLDKDGGVLCAFAGYFKWNVVSRMFLVNGKLPLSSTDGLGQRSWLQPNKSPSGHPLYAPTRPW